MQAEANPVPCSACFAASVLALLALIAGLSDATAVGSPVPGVTSSSSSSFSSTSSASAGSSSASGTLSSRTVRTKYGVISGVIVTFDSRHLEPVEAFRGVPYASPPTGNLRFMPPVTGAMWSGVRLSDRFGPVCPQRLPDISNETLALRRMPKGRLEYLKKLLPYLNNQSEDCLYLNIYAPAQAGTRESGGLSRYPVMVFVHGESYEWNSGNPYDGSVLASYGGVVVVTINYRLGVLGFLNANTDAHLRSPSNYGLMDQIAALHWIQENIAAFGGDPGNVTVVGHGTGAACVHFLMASSAVPDGMLFHRAVLMSGSALSPWALIQTPSRYAHQVARHANCSPDLPHTHLLKCLRERPLASLLAAPVRAPEFTFAFGPSVDGVVIDSGEPPGGGGGSGGDGPGSQFSSSSNNGGIGNMDLNALNSLLLRKSVVSRLAKYDLLLGVVKAEAYFSFSGEDVQYGIESDRRSKILRTYVRNTFRYHLSEILATIVNEYTDWERPVQHPINIRDETLEALSDAQVVAPVVHTADLHSSARKNSYLYVFDYQTKYGDYPQRQGCIHGEELPYLFGVPLVGGMNHFPRNYTKSEILLSEAAMIYWSNFARAGNPNEPQEQDLVHGVRLERNRFKNIEWTAYEAVHKKYLILDTKPRVKSHFRAHRLSFWLNLVPDLHRPGGDDVPSSHHLLDDHDHGAPRAGATPPPSRAPKGSTLGTTPGLAGHRGGAIIGNASGTSQSLLPSVVESSGTTPPSHEPEDGFAAYSTALSLTIAIGCSLLILNVMVFAGVYYRRDKTRLHQEGEAASGSDKRNENGRMPNSICADLLVTGGGDARSEVVAAVKLSDHGAHHIHSRHNQYQLPEFSAPASHDNSSKTLPKPPPPPRTVKPPTTSPSKPNLLQGCGCAPESQPLLPSHNLQHLNAALGGSGGTLKKKHENKTQDKPSVEDLRV